MKRAIVFLILTAIHYLAAAQGAADVGKIPLSIEMPAAMDGIDAANMAKLETKAAQIVTAAGMAPVGYAPYFAIYPTLTITESNVVEGGMQNLTVVKAELTLFIKQLDNGALIASTVKQLTGSGTTAANATGNAIAQVSPNDKDLKTFIQTGREKIIAYYNNDCSDVISMADNMAARQQYTEALGMLMSIPAEAKGCYGSAQAKATDMYTAYEKQQCSALVTQAKAQIAATHYDDALAALSQVDPASPCGPEAERLIQATGDKVAEGQRMAWALVLKIYNDQVALENHRINAMKEIAAIEYKEKPKARRRVKKVRVEEE